MTDIATRLWDAICEMQAADGAMTKAGFVRRYEEIVAADKPQAPASGADYSALISSMWAKTLEDLTLPVGTRESASEFTTGTAIYFR